jgi:hypothetical protein
MEDNVANEGTQAIQANGVLPDAPFIRLIPNIIFGSLVKSAIGSDTIDGSLADFLNSTG